MLPISVLISTLNCANEIQLIEGLPLLKDVDEVIVVDHFSTDKTAELAKKLGAKVYSQEFSSEIVTETDVQDFEHRFGFKPIFKSGDKILNGAKELNKCLKYCKNDWVLYLAGDEKVIWDVKEIQELIKSDADLIQCQFYPKYEDRNNSFVDKRLFKRSKAWYVCMIHTIAQGYNLKEVAAKEMYIDHHQLPKAYRELYVRDLEYAFLHDASSRMCFYLAREYFHHIMFDKALQFFKIYLTISTNIPEIAKAYTLMSGCQWSLKHYEESFDLIFKSVQLYPSRKAFEVLENMMKETNSPYVDIWKKITAVIPHEHF
jgi:glycosyltransferase involved in cell wall biosynthesis